MMNRRGAATIALWLIFVFAIAAAASALFAFVTHSTNFGERAADNERVVTGALFAQEYIEQSAKQIMRNASASSFSKEAIISSAEKANLHLAGQGNFFEKMENGEFEIRREGGNAVLKVENILVYRQSGLSSIKREFDLEIETASSGEFIRFINN